MLKLQCMSKSIKQVYAALELCESEIRILVGEYFNTRFNIIRDEKCTTTAISDFKITNKEELPGAHLVVKDYDGNVIDEWISTTTPHMMEELKPGIYTLNETIAPNGYILSDETILDNYNENNSFYEELKEKYIPNK